MHLNIHRAFLGNRQTDILRQTATTNEQMIKMRNFIKNSSKVHGYKVAGKVAGNLTIVESHDIN